MARQPFICFSGIAPNVGDTAIGLSILQGLRARLPLPVRVHSERPEVFAALPALDGFAEIRRKVPAVPVPARSAAFPFQLQRLLRDLRRTGGAGTLPPPVFAALRDTLAGCAAVVFQGGPTWNDRMMNRRKALERWLFVEAARHYGARVYHVGVSCGPFAWDYPQRLWMAPLVRQALNRHDILLVRDLFSRPALERLGVTARVIESTDAAVFLVAAPDPAFAPVEACIEASAGRRRVVVCVRDFQPIYADACAVREATLARLAALLDRVQAELADVFFLSTDHTPRADKLTDADTARQVQRRMTVPGSTLIDVDVRNPAALKHIYGRFDAMVSMRLHPAILALGGGVPALLLAYDAKCDDFFSRLGLAEQAVPLDRFDARAAYEQVARMLATPDLRRDIAARYAALRAAHAGDCEPMFRQIAARAEEIAGGAGAAAAAGRARGGR